MNTKINNLTSFLYRIMVCIWICSLSSAIVGKRRKKIILISRDYFYKTLTLHRVIIMRILVHIYLFVCV